MITLVLPLPQWRLRSVPGVPERPALLLQVPAAVPAVGVLADPLARPVVDALGVSDGGPEAGKGHTELYR